MRRLKQRLEPPLRAGENWTEAEDRELLEAFDAGAAVEALAERHARTRSAVISRLVNKFGRWRTLIERKVLTPPAWYRP